MPKKRKTTAQQRARAAARAGGKYTTALRAQTGQAAEPSGGHRFFYEDSELLRCWECLAYEETVRHDDGTIPPCSGVREWGGDPERAYLLLTTDIGMPASERAMITGMAGETGLGRVAPFGVRGRYMLFESAPSVVDDLAARIEETTAPGEVEMTLLSAEDGDVIVIEHYLADLAEGGEVDGPPRGLTIPTPIRTQGGVEFTPHPAARPTVLCQACRKDRIVLVAIESVGALRWVYACPACGVQTIGWRRDPHDRPSFAHTDVMPWTIDHRPADPETPSTPVSVARLSDLGQVFDVLAALPVHPDGGSTSRPLNP